MNMAKHKGIILIVDDTPSNLGFLSKILKSAGYSVRPALNGRLALQAAENEPPDIVLLDINMPDMNGYEVCEKLKSNEKLKAIPVLYISALTETEDKIKAFETGGLDYITKPFQAEEVLARVETHLNLRRYQIELQEQSTSLQKALVDLQEAQTKLVQSEKMASLGVLTAGIAHEINNPVNFVSSGIIGLAKLLKDIRRVLDLFDQIKPANVSKILDRIADLKREVEYDDLLNGVRELTKNIQTGAARVAEIVRGLRTFSGRDENEKKAIDLHENIESALMLLRRQYKDHMIVKKEFGRIPMVLCFPGKLNQALMNILCNAIDAVKAGNSGTADASISIETSLTENNGHKWVVIAITDTGPGIAKDVREHLFEPFFTTKEVGRNVGLGLSITHAIINDHGGRIDVESKAGEGATFTIYLPLEQ